MLADNEVLVRYIGPGPAVLAGLFIGNGESRWVTRGALDQARVTHPAEHFEEVESREAPSADYPPAVATISTDMPTPPTYDAQGRMIAGPAAAAPHFVAGGVDDTGASSSPAPRFVEGLDYPPGNYPTGGVPAAGGPEASGGANPVRPVVVTVPVIVAPNAPSAPTGVDPWPAATTITPPASVEPWPAGVSGPVAPAVNLPQVTPSISEEQANAADFAEFKRQAAKRGRAAK
jgi:hypothetical protein